MSREHERCVRKFYLVAGIKSNYRQLIGDAIGMGRRYGFVVRVLDINNLVPKLANDKNEWDKLGIIEHVDIIKNRRMLRLFVSENMDETSIILFLNLPDKDLRPIWATIRKSKVSLGVITLSTVPNGTTLEQNNRPLEKLLFAVMKQLRGIKSLMKPKPDMWVLSGAACLEQYSSYFRSTINTKFIYTHSIEYEKMYFHKQSWSGGTTQKHGYILLLDQGWFSKLGVGVLPSKDYPPANYHTFQAEIIKFLKQLEITYNKPVLISNHPKADLAHTKKLYYGYKVSEVPSESLVKNATFVVANTTTSLSYAVMQNKPILLITTDELRNSIMRPLENAFETELDTKYLNISHQNNRHEIQVKIQENTACYQQYIKRHITHSQAGSKSLWANIFEQLSETQENTATN